MTLQAIVPAGGGTCQEVELKASRKDTCAKLKKDLEKAFNIPVDDMEIFFQNAEEGSRQKWLRDDVVLEAEDVRDGAILTVGVHGVAGGGHQNHVEDEDLPEDAVQNSIAVKGETSYYFAHSRKADVPEEHRIVSGGEPQKLCETEALKEPMSSMRKIRAEEEGLLRPERAILNYAWGDEKEVVKIYVSADGEPLALAAAKDGKSDEVEVSWRSRAATLRIHAEKLDWVLDLDRLYYEIVPEECKFRVSENKRITLTLKKKEAYAWLKLLKPDA